MFSRRNISCSGTKEAFSDRFRRTLPTVSRDGPDVQYLSEPFSVKMKAIFPLASFEVFKTIPCSTYMKTQSGLLCQVHFKINIDCLCRIVERKCVSCNACGEEQPRPAINAAYILEFFDGSTTLS